MNYPLSKLANNEMLDFSMYTIENRAIPDIIDGLKPVQRFYLYSSIKNSPKDFKKVSAVAGVVSDYGYAHGEASAAGTGQLMAAEWNNNVCLIEGRGSFGTRMVPEAGAPRYVYTRLHANFNKYIKDLELSPVHPDPEHQPPSCYIPVIPLVLANGTKGIATGFATNILPRSIKDLTNACKEYITTGNIKKRLPISYPQFNGTVEHVQDSKYMIRGVFSKPSSTKLIITEVPYGVSRVQYVEVLNKLEDDGDIVSYEDRCSSDGFNFEVTLKRASSAKWNDEKIYSKFKLEKSVSENITVMDINRELKEFDDERDLIKEFVDYRLEVTLAQRIDNKKTLLLAKGLWLIAKRDFVRAVLDEKIVFKNKKKADVIKQILDVVNTDQEGAEKLLQMNIVSLTDEMVKQLEKEIKDVVAERKFWEKETPTSQFLSDLDSL